MLYLSTFISGLQEVACGILAEKGVRKPRLVLDGAILYDSPRPLDPGCFNNTFEVVHHQRTRPAEGLDAYLASLLKQRRLDFAARRSKRNLSFRIVTSHENKLVSVNAAGKASLERLIQQQTGLRVSRAKADTEYWLLSRREGYSFFMKRVSKGRVGEKQLAKGTLRPELCCMLNWLSHPERSDVFLDPFAGSGAIPFSRAKMAGFRHMYLFDKSRDAVAALQRKADAVLGPKRMDVTAKALDITEVPAALPAHSIDKIVTDPPWGFFEAIEAASLYRQIFDAFAAVTRHGAVIVLLSAQKETVEAAVARLTDVFLLRSTYHILVSGKKAAVYVIDRI